MGCLGTSILEGLRNSSPKGHMDGSATPRPGGLGVAKTHIFFFNYLLFIFKDVGDLTIM